MATFSNFNSFERNNHQPLICQIVVASPFSPPCVYFRHNVFKSENKGEIDARFST